MGTFPTISQTGGPFRWILQGQNITNHEVFAFALQSYDGPPAGAIISDIAVFNIGQVGAPNLIEYYITLNAVDINSNPVNETITGYFESTGV
jgi:hypothetical protein